MNKNEDVLKFIDEVCPNHERTSCDDSNLNNIYHVVKKDRDGYFFVKDHPCCLRCFLLGVARGVIDKSDVVLFGGYYTISNELSVENDKLLGDKERKEYERLRKKFEEKEEQNG